jgi:hypothetical protein
MAVIPVLKIGFANLEHVLKLLVVELTELLVVVMEISAPPLVLMVFVILLTQ